MLEWLFHISVKCTAVECSSFQFGMVNIESKSFDRNKGDLSERAKCNHTSVKWETVGKTNFKKTTEKIVMKLLNTAYGHFTWTDNLKPENLHLNYKNNIMERKNMNKIPWFKKKKKTLISNQESGTQKSHKAKSLWIWIMKNKTVFIIIRIFSS